MAESTSTSNYPFLLVGLGNPGREYRSTRHNVGYMVIDRLCGDLGIKLNRLRSKALIGQGLLEGKKVILAKPQTYMNLSGQAVSSLIRYYKIPLDQLLILHDDIDLPVGTLRLRPSGGSAGQRGLASIITQLGTQDFARLRIGIGRPVGQKEAANYVLDNFSSDDLDLITLVLDRAAEAAKMFVVKGLDQAMNTFNGALQKD